MENEYRITSRAVSPGTGVVCCVAADAMGNAGYKFLEFENYAQARDYQGSPEIDLTTTLEALAKRLNSDFDIRNGKRSSSLDVIDWVTMELLRLYLNDMFSMIDREERALVTYRYETEPVECR